MTSITQRALLGLFALAACKSAPEHAPDSAPKALSERAPAAATVVPAEPATHSRAAGAPHVYNDQTHAISAHVGERFEVALPGNITTPLKWSLDPASMSDVVTLSDQSYSDTPPADCEGCVGYPGTAHFVLDAAQEGTTTLRFAYRKLGQTSGEAKREVAIALTVTP